MLKPNEKLAIEDLYFNGGKKLVIRYYDKLNLQAKDTRIFGHITRYSQTADIKELLLAIDAVKCMRNHMRTGSKFNCLHFEYRKIDHLYIWRTQVDDRVRKDHWERDGKIFDDRSEDVHPGKDYGCRCIAEYNIPVWVNIVK